MFFYSWAPNMSRKEREWTNIFPVPNLLGAVLLNTPRKTHPSGMPPQVGHVGCSLQGWQHECCGQGQQQGHLGSPPSHCRGVSVSSPFWSAPKCLWPVTDVKRAVLASVQLKLISQLNEFESVSVKALSACGVVFSCCRNRSFLQGIYLLICWKCFA